MCLFTSARTVAIVFARSAGSEAMYCAGVLTFDGGFMDSSSSRTKCVTDPLKTSQRQGCEYRVSPSRAQARRLLSVLKVITRRKGGGRVFGTKRTDGTFSDIYLNYFVGQILIGGSRKRELPVCPHLSLFLDTLRHMVTAPVL